MAYEAPKKPLFRKLDNYLLHVSDLEQAISFIGIGSAIPSSGGMLNPPASRCLKLTQS
ncbi:hypothetical protein G9X64_15135 [Rhizobium sophorae]|uniref:Uncharacterized protein n=1 Tax=Rhizobium sophorae TaxID=1535242 RepID=A0A7Y3S715_9HYPH|nr:hypothetical protein [Rhizobium sophorae]NNU37801.1 hypothetical protein [Rhizobium sophorae]